MGFGRLHAVMRKTRLLAILATEERNCGGDPGRDWPYCIMNVRMFECLDWKQPEQLIKTTCIWCAGQHARVF